MTANQIAYAKYLEDSRHNQSMEGENFRHNVAQESENFRHNAATENLQDRGNILNYQASIYSADVAKYNAEVSAASHRYAADVSAAASRYASDNSLAASKYSSDTSWGNNRLNYSETQRHNIAMEQIEGRKANQSGLKTVISGLKDFASLAGSVAAFMA